MPITTAINKTEYNLLQMVNKTKQNYIILSLIFYFCKTNKHIGHFDIHHNR